MDCANSFNILATLNVPPPNELKHHPRTFRKASFRGSTGLVRNAPRSADQQCGPQRRRMNESNISRSTQTGTRNCATSQNSNSVSLPPRFQRPQNQVDWGRVPPGLGLSPPPCPRPDPYLTPTSTFVSDELNQNSKQQMFLALQQPPAMCSGMISQPTCAPTPPSQPHPTRVQQANIPPSLLAQQPPGLGQPQMPELISRNAGVLATSPQKTGVSLPPPPGLPRPNGHRLRRNNHDNRLANRDHRLQESLEGLSFERHNPVVASRVFSPPPVSNAVKLPGSKSTQPRPPSPSTSASSLSDDLAGSSALPSDTTFTSVESTTSDKVSRPSHPKMHPWVCRNWTMGYPCYKNPCKYQHPPPPGRAGILSKQLKQTPLAPHLEPSPGVAKALIHTCGATNGVIPRKKQDPPSVPVDPPPRSEPLYATTIADHIKVRFDEGFQVREVVTGFESRWVHLGNIASSVTSAALNKLLAPYKVDTVNLPESLGKPVTVKVQFATHADALKAVADLNGAEFSGKTISAKSAINNSLHGSTVLRDTDVQVVWECPSRVGYAGYDTIKEAKAALDAIDGKPFQDVVVTAQLYEGIPCIGAYNVIFKQLPASVDELGLRIFANSKSVMLGRPNYQSLDKAIKAIRSRLEEYGTVVGFDIIAPPFRGGLVKAWAHFTTPAEAHAAQADFDRRRPKYIGHTTLSCQHIVSVSHSLSSVIYRKMREDIGWLRGAWHDRYGPGVSIRERNKEIEDDGPIHIRISSDRSELLSTLKYEFEQLLHGDTLLFNKKPLWDDFLVAEAGRTFIAEVQAKYPGIQVQVQNNRRVISLWGPILMRQNARQEIVRKIMELKAQQFWKIPLSGRLVGVFCSAELTTLQELLGPGNCILDLSERVLIIRGNDAAFRTACSVVQAAQATQNRQGDEVRASSDVICPVCFGEAIVPVTLTCGHQWCRACLTGYLTSAVENKLFPLRCLGDEATCTQCIPLGLSRKILSADGFNAVLEAAFWVYVHSRPDEFFNCPTPDCTQVYRSAPPNVVLQCPKCLVRICPACRIEYHDGLTCEERDVADDKLFKEWSSNHDVKGCPGCKAPIERSEGCNHMTCTRCQTHICWECLATFPRGQGIYEHMRMQHGSIGL